MWRRRWCLKEREKMEKYGVDKKSKDGEILTEEVSLDAAKQHTEKKVRVGLSKFWTALLYFLHQFFCQELILQPQLYGREWKFTWVLLVLSTGLLGFPDRWELLGFVSRTKPVKVKELDKCLLWFSVHTSQESLWCCWHVTGSFVIHVFTTQLFSLNRNEWTINISGSERMN